MSQEGNLLSDIFKRWPKSTVVITGETLPVKHFVVRLEARNEGGQDVGPVVSASASTRVSALRGVLGLKTPKRAVKRPATVKQPVADGGVATTGTFASDPRLHEAALDLIVGKAETAVDTGEGDE